MRYLAPTLLPAAYPRLRGFEITCTSGKRLRAASTESSVDALSTMTSRNCPDWGSARRCAMHAINESHVFQLSMQTPVIGGHALSTFSVRHYNRGSQEL